MSEIHIRQLEAHLDKTFKGFIDISDLKDQGEDLRKKTLTRCLAAYAMAEQANLTPELAAACVVDGTLDNGIDAIYFDDASTTLFVVQSKWNQTGQGGIKKDDVHKFTGGVKDLLNARYERFNPKIQAKKEQIEKALTNPARFQLVYVHTGNDDIASDIQNVFDDFRTEVNDAGEALFVKTQKLKDLYKILLAGGKPDAIDLKVDLNEWGMISEPYKAFYGQIPAGSVAKWFDDFGQDLFEPNLRNFLGSTEVNKRVSETFTKEPANFWYFNNGITALCDKIVKTNMASGTRTTGTFDCKGFKIVNGAQTVGAVAAAAKELLAQQPNDALIHLRIISLEGCPENIATAITLATNTQNKIETRDFVAADKEQKRIKDELAVDGISYLLKSGESHKKQDQSFDINEATVSLACSHPDTKYAMMAKREISTIWEDISAAPYKALFNPILSGQRLWCLVKLQRAIDEKITEHSAHLNDFAKKCGQHGNRFIAHEVYKRLSLKNIEIDVAAFQACTAAISELVKAKVSLIPRVIEELYPNVYLGNIFKSFDKCKEISDKIADSASLKSNDNETQFGDLFSQASDN